MKSKRLNSKNKLNTPSSGTTNYVDYSAEKKILEVEFTGGKTYHYLNVEPAVWQNYKKVIMEGKSSGEFVNYFIKPNYSYEETD